MDTRDHRHGGPYDRGSADYYYGRPFNPHYFKGATYASEEIKITDENSKEYQEYKAGYDEMTGQKDWG